MAADLRSSEAETPLHLDVTDDGKQLKLFVQHTDIGPVCELWCYEGGPFRYGTAVRHESGRVVFVHTCAAMTATTTFTPQGADRVRMDIDIEGPLESLKQVLYVGPCMQFWHSEAFQQQGSLAEFAGRCFLYTLRGPVGMLDTARGPMPGFPRDAPENRPPWTQWYVPIQAVHPGSIWAFGSSGDRPLHSLVAVASRDGRWLAAIGCASARTLGQGWHDCIHHVPQMQDYLDEDQGRILHRSMLYVLPNDKGRLLEGFRQDFPDVSGDSGILAAIDKEGRLQVGPRSQHAPKLALQLEIATVGRQEQHDLAWEVSPWGGFVGRSTRGTIWAYPSEEAVELYVSLAPGVGPAYVNAILNSAGWTTGRAPRNVPAPVRRSSEGDWTAALLWERSEPARPDRGLPAPDKEQGGTASVRGRLVLYKSDVAALRALWTKTCEDWQHAVPYRMPAEAPSATAQEASVRFAPNAQPDMAYGLTIVPPWKEGGTLHVNFPEHLEHGDVGHGILRHHDKRANVWQIAPDGRSASYEVESPELPGVIIRAVAVAASDRARLTLKITNGGAQTLEHVKPLLCFWYAALTGFPERLSANFQYTYVVMDDNPVSLASIPTSNPEATAKVAYVRGCTRHDCDKFAQSRGGLIERDVDCALIAVTARDGKRKVIIGFTPGKSILSNAFIPCAHADPYFGTIEPGASAEATGLILFTTEPLEGYLTQPVRV